MSFSNEVPRPVIIKDEGVTIVDNVNSIDFTGAGITGSALGDNATEDITSGGDMVLASAQTNSGIKTFLDTTMKLRNVANTFDGYFVNTNTANRIYTLQDRAGTLADNTDLALKANLASPTFTGTVTIPTPFTIGAVSMTATGTELNYVVGVTSAIQTQLNAKQGTLTNSAGLLAALSDETGTGLAVFNNAPALIAPALGTVASGVISACTSTSMVMVTPVLGTPTSGTLTNCTFPTLNQNTTGTAAGLSATLAIASGGTGATTLAGASIPTYTSTNTFTNKRVTPRVTSETSSATPTINSDNSDAHSVTALALAITSFTTNLTGTPTNFQKLTIRIKDDATARAITWGASFVDKGVALPTTTVISKCLTVGFIYDTVAAVWGCVAVANET